MKGLRTHIVFFFLLMSFSPSLLKAEPVSYSFCISSEDFPTFKAVVYFRAVDFGSKAAEQMVRKRLKPHLGDDFSISPFDSETCLCEGTCAVLEVTAEDWDGDINEAETSTIMGSAAESLDLIIYNAREIFSDPGGFIKKAFFGSKREEKEG